MGDQRRLRNTPRYKNMRREFMQDAPLCAKCQRDGFTVGAQELDHMNLFTLRRRGSGIGRICKGCVGRVMRIRRRGRIAGRMRWRGTEVWKALASREDSKKGA